MSKGLVISLFFMAATSIFDKATAQESALRAPSQAQKECQKGGEEASRMSCGQNSACAEELLHRTGKWCVQWINEQKPPAQTVPLPASGFMDRK